MSGKGSSPRPFSVSNEEYEKRWDAIFGRVNDTGKDKKKEEDCKHQVWGHREGTYFCIDCGVENEAGPYVSR